MSKVDWHSESMKWRRIANEKFNKEWVSQHHLSVGSSEHFDHLLYSKEGYNIFQLVWLKNLDLIMSILPYNIDVRYFTLIDIGCGSGISTIYFGHYYPFKKLIGIDIDQILIDMALKNHESYGYNEKYVFQCDNILNIFLTMESSYFLYFFNSLSCDLFLTFLNNNWNVLKETNSVLAINYDVCRNLFLEKFVFASVIKNETNNISILFF